MKPWEEHLRVLVGQAGELRGTGYIVDASRAIEEEFDRQFVNDWEHEAPLLTDDEFRRLAKLPAAELAALLRPPDFRGEEPLDEELEEAA